MKLMPQSDIKYIIVHTSVSKWGGVKDIDEWHKERGFEGIGYHFVITNGYLKYSNLKEKKYVSDDDGVLWVGRPLKYRGAHCPDYNWRSIGVCLIGDLGNYTPLQWTMLKSFCLDWMDRLNIPVENVLGHCETPNGKSQGKTCPDITMFDFRLELAEIQSGIRTI